ncbi:hypothetical protein BV898_11447 [Hypsibius exemplaris]|uniref:Uncharacterized protein n=1 Tax=Hypsibius exemplaris TaxID=2072580 RepID=A0A1W0WGK0_HYPEX|nr:hypothetical protein BV898_11447 [Hypsibius exemplaris]
MIIGIVASLLSAVFLSLHQIAFMKSFPMGNLGQVSFALTGMNILICLIYWPVPLALHLTGIEVYDITDRFVPPPLDSA